MTSRIVLSRLRWIRCHRRQAEQTARSGRRPARDATSSPRVRPPSTCRLRERRGAQSSTCGRLFDAPEDNVERETGLARDRGQHDPQATPPASGRHPARRPRRTPPRGRLASSDAVRNPTGNARRCSGRLRPSGSSCGACADAGQPRLPATQPGTFSQAASRPSARVRR